YETPVRTGKLPGGARARVRRWLARSHAGAHSKNKRLLPAIILAPQARSAYEVPSLALQACRLWKRHARLEIPCAAPRPPGKLRTAIDRQRATGDVFRVGIHQEEHTAGNFFRPGHPTAGQRGASLVHHLFAEKLAFARRVGPARVKNVDADAVRR